MSSKIRSLFILTVILSSLYVLGGSTLAYIAIKDLASGEVVFDTDDGDEARSFLDEKSEEVDNFYHVEVTKENNFHIMERLNTFSCLKNIKSANISCDVGDNAFYRCKNLNRVRIVGAKNIYFCAFLECKNLNYIHICDGAEFIGECAFAGCTSLDNIEIPRTVEFIGRNAFGGCENLAHINIPNGIAKIKSDTFLGCTKLDDVVISESVKEIGSGSFAGCTSLTHINIPEGIVKIKSGTFAGCTKLDNVVIPESVKEIGECAFAGCTNLTNISIPKGIKIAPDAFEGCPAKPKFYTTGSSCSVL